MHKSPRKSPRSLKQVAKQKTSMRYVVAGSSILMMVLGVFVYLNVTNKQESKAKGTDAVYAIGYQNVDKSVPVLLEVAKNDERKKPFDNYKETPGGVNKSFDASNPEKFEVKYTKPSAE